MAGGLLSGACRYLKAGTAGASGSAMGGVAMAYDKNFPLRRRIMAMAGVRIGFLGAGKMASALAKGWHTVRQAFYSGPNGRYRMRYRFARFYTSNVSYRFRVKVLRERGWPYKAPVSSRVRRLVVKAH